MWGGLTLSQELAISAEGTKSTLINTPYYARRTLHPNPDTNSRYQSIISSILTVTSVIEHNGTEVYCRDGMVSKENMLSHHIQRATATVLGKIAN